MIGSQTPDDVLVRRALLGFATAALPLVRVLATTPPAVEGGIGLRGRGIALAGRVAGSVARPEAGTLEQRCDWWVRTIGGFAAVAVTAASTTGPLADRAAAPDLLGSAAECLVVCGIAGEYGVTDRGVAAALLGHVLFDRDIPVLADESGPVVSTTLDSRALIREALSLGRGLRGLTEELVDRRAATAAPRRFRDRMPGYKVAADLRAGRSSLSGAAERARGWLALAEQSTLPSSEPT